MQREKWTKRDRLCAAAAALLFAAAAVLQFAARFADGFADWYARRVYPAVVGVFGRFFGLFSFSAVEMLLYAGIVCGILYLAGQLRRPFGAASRVLLTAAALLFLYMTGCGINYHAAAFSSYADLTAGTYTKEELTALCEYLTDQVNAYVPLERETYAYKSNREAWRRDSVQAMKAAGALYPVLAGYYPEPKEVAVSWILSVQQLSGVYSPFTVEANYNGDMPDYNIPHTMCHELSHLKGFMREDEANFIGYLACILSENPAFRYSGYLTGWVYAGNALAQADPETYSGLYGRLCLEAREDLLENNAFWDQFEGRVAEVSTRWNDAYLKMNAQEDGVRSYGRMVDLMLARQRQEAEKSAGELEE
ncbi:MAG: DUF3810 domain-containing protein [Eubacteriales bacterium]|nr:DUF3810 domain-containing protein [Eubacteriales bacterium]